MAAEDVYAARPECLGARENERQLILILTSASVVRGESSFRAPERGPGALGVG